MAMDRNLNEEVQKHFGNRFSATDAKTRFGSMLEHFAQKFSLKEDQVREAYERVNGLFLEGRVEKFDRYFAAALKGISGKENRFSNSEKSYKPDEKEQYKGRTYGREKSYGKTDNGRTNPSTNRREAWSNKNRSDKSNRSIDMQHP